MKAKKHLGQHFLIDKGVINEIIESIGKYCSKDMPLLEVGPGMGVLTHQLVEQFPLLKAIEFDADMVRVLVDNIPGIKILNEDFLSSDLSTLFTGQAFNLVGNFPYNISSQIIFKMIKNVELIENMVGMFQKEVASRICAVPGNKNNGILSLRIQAHYTTHHLFDIGPEAFNPPPKVQSSVIFLKRKDEYHINCNEALYGQIIKTAFQQRRKKMRNTLKTMVDDLTDPIFQKRPEELNVEDFVNITKIVENQ